MNMRALASALTWVVAVALSAQTVFDPSGHYELETRGFELDSDTYIGPSGTINVERSGRDAIVVQLIVVRGWPSYNMGELTDTTVISNGIAVITTEDDSSCVITLVFDRSGVKVTQVADNLNFACGFGHAVVAEGYYRKIPSGEKARPWYLEEQHDCISPLQHVQARLGRLTAADMDPLVNSFHPACLNNVEYGEWANKLFFEALDEEPKMFTDALERAIEYWQWPYILHTFAHPVNDALSDRIPAIKTELENTDVTNPWLKERLLQALDGDFH